MITILLISILCYILISIYCDGYISKPNVFSVVVSIFIGVFITTMLSAILFGCNVGQYETVFSKEYDNLYIIDDECCVTYYEYNDDGTYTIDNLEIDLINCLFVDDGTQVVKHQRWNFGKGLNWLFLLPLQDSYIITIRPSETIS